MFWTDQPIKMYENNLCEDEFRIKYVIWEILVIIKIWLLCFGTVRSREKALVKSKSDF